jgi:hypothetical protein
MRFLAWRNDSRIRTILIVLTVIATIALAAHPELRLLVPVVDSLGLDLMVLLLGSQLLEFARPMLQPLASVAWRSVVYMLGILGPYLDGALRAR